MQNLTMQKLMPAKKQLLLIGAAGLAGTVIGWTGQSLADQPQMTAALASLRQARAHLSRATADKGGYRKQALLHVDLAIKDVQAGIWQDRRNPYDSKTHR